MSKREQPSTSKRKASHGGSMIRAANRIHFARKAAGKADALRSRNAYRAAVGLPLIRA